MLGTRPLPLSFVAGLALSSAAGTAQELTLAPLFSEGMLIQRNVPVRVHGTAPAGESVVITCGPAQAKAVADGQDGSFDAWLPAQPATAEGASYRFTAQCGDAKIEFGHVRVGELWIASGQSNMEWQMRKFAELEEEIASAKDDELCLFTVGRATSRSDRATCKGSWSGARPNAVRAFSAVGYFFGRELRRALQVPVGIVASSWGGTRIEAWTRQERLAAHPAGKPIVDAWQARDPESEDRHAPGRLYAGMIAPLTTTTVAGFLWYQGESNAGRAEQYRDLLPLMIDDWRQVFGQGDLPMLVVQLASIANERRTGWDELRDAQLAATRALPAVGMSVTIDLGDPKQIHPGRKDEVGRRLALLARRDVYGETSLVAEGPRFRSMRIEGRSRVRVMFDSVGGGLTCRHGDTLEGFELAGADRVYAPAEARIVGRDVLVYSKDVPHPVAVRYGWRRHPADSLGNDAGLPATPFRSDRWPGATAGAVSPF